MIEQTELMVTKWHFDLLHTSNNPVHLTNYTTVDILPKRNSIKKGFVCRLSCRFTNEEGPVLDYTAEHSYVIDFDELIDKKELLKMFRNSFAGFEEKFEFRKHGTILQNEKLRALDEAALDLDSILLQ